MIEWDGCLCSVPAGFGLGTAILQSGVLLQRRESAVGTEEPACSIGGRFGLDSKVVCMCMCALVCMCG